MLIDLRTQLRERGPSSVAGLARRLDAQPDAVRAMLDHWARRGEVTRVAAACGGCTSCDLADARTDADVYVWLGGGGVPGCRR